MPGRIGGASGFWGDSRVGAPQLVRSGQIDYLVFDYLAETTMAILATARRKNAELGYATDFVDVTMKAVLPDVMRQGIKVVANAGGINPQGCADALRRVAQGFGLAPRIAVIDGDDVSAQLPGQYTLEQHVQARLASSARVTRDAGSRPSCALIQAPQSTSFCRSMPVSAPRPSSR